MLGQHTGLLHSVRNWHLITPVLQVLTVINDLLLSVRQVPKLIDLVLLLSGHVDLLQALY
jgi:hypothetical protein